VGKKGKRNWIDAQEPLVVKMTEKERLELTIKIIKEVFIEQKKVLDHWKRITGQPSQVDSGYLAQHLISLLTGIPGEGLRGKGIDLGDNSEIKSACCVGGIDIPRWNLNFQNEEDMDDLLKIPNIYFILFDEKDNKLRVRVWRIDPDKDEAFKKTFAIWRSSERKSNNFQIHPPVKKDSNIATNLSGNLELPLMYEARENESGEIEITHFKNKGLPYSKYIENDRSNSSKII
jgi:hypothetical protein